jgi:hypothetical protein
MTPDARVHFEDWDLFALGVLDEAEHRAMADHLASGCDDCMRLFEASEIEVAGIATLSPDEPLPAGAEMRLQKRLEAAGVLATAPITQIPGPAPARIWMLAPWVLAAACLVAAVEFGVNLGRARHQLRELEHQNADYIEHIQHESQGTPRQPMEVTSAQVDGLHATIEGLQRDLKSAQAAKLAAQDEVKAAKAQLADAQTRVHELDTSLKDADARRAKAEDALFAAHLQLAKAQTDADTLAQISAQNDKIVGLLEAAPLNQLDLKPAGEVQASARVFWHDDHGLLLVARNLPHLSPRASFQLWFYRKGTPEYVNVGVVQVDSSGDGLLFVPPGPALVSMTGALLTEESGNTRASAPGEEILKIKP